MNTALFIFLDAPTTNVPSPKREWDPRRMPFHRVECGLATMGATTDVALQAIDSLNIFATIEVSFVV